MKNEIMEILERLNKGKINSETALKLIKKTQDSNESITKKSSKIKITVIDMKEGKNVRIPAIPYWLITSLGNIGIKISLIALKNSKKIDEDTKKYLNILKDFNLREIFNILEKCEPCDIVHVIEEKGNGSEVRISIM